MTTISDLWRYPVKSMMGERLDGLDLGLRGVVGDRGWATRDEVRGGIRGAKKLGGLMRFAARYDGEVPGPATITLPGGDEVATDHPDVNDRVSAALDHPVTLWPLVDDREHYRRGAPDSPDFMVELRSIFSLEDDEPLPDLSIFPPEIMEYESPPGTYLDAFGLLLVTEQSLASLQALAPTSQIDVRRFRPNIVLTTQDDAPFPELAWVGGRFELGETIITVPAACPRCVMVTRGFAELPEDRSIMRTLVRETSQCLGVYATIERPGRISLGDELVRI